MCECCPKKPKKFETAEELRYVNNALSFLFLYAPPFIFGSDFLLEAVLLVIPFQRADSTS